MPSIGLSVELQHLTAIAEAWLASGATTFSLWSQDELLACWPADAAPDKSGLSASIQVDRRTWGQLYLTGSADPAVQCRLNSEARLLAELIKQEEEIESLTAELVSNQDQLLALYKLTETTRSHLNLDQMLYVLLREAVRLIKAVGAFIVLEISGQPPLTITSHKLDLPEAVFQDFFQRVWQAGDELLLRDVDLTDTPLTRPTKVFLKIIPVDESTRAVVGLLLRQPTTALTPHLKLARSVADYAGAQVENALLHKKTLEQARLSTELELAAHIQLQLLPQHPPRVDGLDMAAMSQPALKVGGDFFDFSRQPGGPLFFTLGDVSGKGMSAALLMAMTRTVIRSKANLLPAPTPESVLGSSNEIMYDDFTQVGMFCTIFVGRYDPHQRQIWYANAGHSPVIYCPAGETARLLEADGPALGTLPINLSENQHLPFHTGDLLVIATDGFNEARNANDKFFGIDRMLRLIEQMAHKSAQEISEQLFAAVKQFGLRRPQDDDQTLIVIKGIDHRG